MASLSHSSSHCLPYHALEEDVGDRQQQRRLLQHLPTLSKETTSSTVWEAALSCAVAHLLSHFAAASPCQQQQASSCCSPPPVCLFNRCTAAFSEVFLQWRKTNSQNPSFSSSILKSDFELQLYSGSTSKNETLHH